MRASILRQMIPGIPEELLDAALTMARGITYGKNRAELLATLSRRLPLARSELIEEALAAARAISDDIRQVETLASLLPYIPSDLRGQAQTAVLARARNLNGEQRGTVLLTVARHVTAQDRATLLAEAVWLTSALTVFTAFPHDTQDLFGDALKEAAETEDIWKRLDLLTSLAKAVPDRHIDATLRVIRQLGAAFIPTASYTTIPGVPGKLVARQSVPGLQAKTLAALVPNLPDRFAPTVLDEAIKAAKQLANRLGASSSAVVHPYVAQRVVLQAMRWRSQSDNRKLWMAAHQITGRRLLADALTELLPCLEGDEQNQVTHNALNLYRSVASEWDVFSGIPGADGVSKVMPYLPDRERATLVSDLLASARLRDREWERAHVVENLAAHLSPAQLLEALKILHEIPDEAARCHGLQALARAWAGDPSPLLQEISAVTSPWQKHKVLRRLLRRAGELDQPEHPLFAQPPNRQWPTRLGRDGVLCLIGDSSWWLNRYGGGDAVCEVAQAIDNVTRWWP